MGFTVPQKVLFRHCDPAGIVFFPRYFEMVNDCVEAFFDQALGFSFAELHRIAAVPTVQISTKFSAPSRHGDMLNLTLDVTKLGRTSMAIDVTATCEQELRFHSTSTLVYIDPTGAPTPWPAPLRGAIKQQIAGAS